MKTILALFSVFLVTQAATVLPLESTVVNVKSERSGQDYSYSIHENRGGISTQEIKPQQQPQILQQQQQQPQQRLIPNPILQLQQLQLQQLQQLQQLPQLSQLQQQQLLQPQQQFTQPQQPQQPLQQEQQTKEQKLPELEKGSTKETPLVATQRSATLLQLQPLQENYLPLPYQYSPLPSLTYYNYPSYYPYYYPQNVPIQPYIYRI